MGQGSGGCVGGAGACRRRTLAGGPEEGESDAGQGLRIGTRAQDLQTQCGGIARASAPGAGSAAARKTYKMMRWKRKLSNPARKMDRA